MSDTIEILEATLAGSEKAVRDRDQEIALLKTTIKGFEAALDLANEKASKAIAPDAQHFADVVDSVVSDKLIEKIEERDQKIYELEARLHNAYTLGNCTPSLMAEIESLKFTIGERDRELEAFKVVIPDSNARYLAVAKKLDAANQALNNIAFQLGFSVYLEDEVAIEIESLLATKASNETKIEQRDCTISDLNLALECVKKNNLSRKTQLEERDRKIEILEDNLNRARSEHLEQLNAIVQMLEPLATHEDKGSLYLSHFGKAAMVYMIQRVIYANIKKLDPKLSAYSDGF